MTRYNDLKRGSSAVGFDWDGCCLLQVSAGRDLGLQACERHCSEVESTASEAKDAWLPPGLLKVGRWSLGMVSLLFDKCRQHSKKCWAPTSLRCCSQVEELKDFTMDQCPAFAITHTCTLLRSSKLHNEVQVELSKV